MQSDTASIFCSICQTRLKRQVLGSNVFYYCRNCGAMSSEACLTGEVSLLRIEEAPTSF